MLIRLMKIGNASALEHKQNFSQELNKNVDTNFIHK